MTTRLCTLLGCLLFVGSTPLTLRAEEPPASPPAAPEAPKDAPAAAPALPPPSKAWRDLQEQLQQGGRPAPGQLEKGAQEYLKAWEASERGCAAEDYHPLGLLLNAAGRRDEANAAFATSAGSEALPDVLRVTSATAFASNAATAAHAGTLKGEALARAVKQVEGWASLGGGPAVGGLRMALGQLHGLVGAVDAALEDYALGVEAQPGLALNAGAQAVRLLLDGTHDLTALPAARAKVGALLRRLEPAATRGLEEARAAAASETDPRQRERREALVKRAESDVKRLHEVGRPLDMIGEAAAEWTLVKAYGQGESLADYRGKVVVLDFWATWCPWCIRSFPALRDLLRDYAGKDLAVVGVTTSAANVFDQRYDLDDDLKAKATGGQVKPVLQRPKPPAATAGAPDVSDPEDQAKQAEAKSLYEHGLAAFRIQEQQVLSTFIRNHAMTWDVVQIDEAEPTPKYALSGWPHCVVIDRQGRVRHFKAGALLRDKPEAVAAFRKVLDALLTEPTN